MNDSPAQAPYQPPTVTFHGRLEELTGSTSLMVGVRVVRFAAAFANSLHTPSPGGGVLSGGPVSSTVPIHGPGGGAGDVATTGGGGVGGGSAGGGGGGGGKLPFTGLAVIAVSGAGAALAAAGAALRRVVRRDAGDDA
jgi:hypothetical protein